MIKCNRCGATNAEDWGTVCRMCGADLPIPEKPQENPKITSKEPFKPPVKVFPENPVAKPLPSLARPSNSNQFQVDPKSGEKKQEVLLENQSSSVSTEKKEDKVFNELDNLMERYLKVKDLIVKDREIIYDFPPPKDGEDTSFIDQGIIDKKIKEFATKFEIEGVLVIDDESLLIGGYYQDKTLKILLENSLPYFLTLNDKFLSPLAQSSSEDRMEIHRYGMTFIFRELIIGENLPLFYLLLIKKKTVYKKEDLDEFINFLKGVLV